jgi:integrase/recombinase XerD
MTGLCEHLVHQGQLSIDPLIAAGLERPKLPKSLPRYVERDSEIARVLVAAGTPDPTGRQPWPERDLALAALLPGTGARASEVCGVRICHLVLDVEDPYVRVTGKGGAVRDCPLPVEVVSAVQTDLASRQSRTRARAPRDDLAWLNTMGNRSLRQRSIIWCAAGSPEPACLSPRGAAAHAFRHTVAMQLVGRGEASNVVHALLGHASLSSTQIYIRSAGHHVREAAHQLPVRGVLRGIRQDTTSR